MNEIIQLGPFMVKYQLIAVLLSAVIGYFLLRYKMNKLNIEPEVFSDVLAGTLFIGIVVWKFGGVFFNPSVLWTNPLSILFISGSEKTIIFAIFSSCLYLGYKLKKGNMPFYYCFDVLPFGILPFVFIYSLLVPGIGFETTLPWGKSLANSEVNYHPIGYYRAVLFAFLTFYILRLKANVGTGINFSQSSIGIGAIGLLTSFFIHQDIVLIGLSFNQLLHLILLLFGIAVFKSNKTVEKDETQFIN